MGDHISKAPIRRLMKAQGAYLVAEDAVVGLVDYLEKYAQEVTKKAIKVAKEDKRKKLTAADVEAAAIVRIQPALDQPLLLQVADERTHGVATYPLPAANLRGVKLAVTSHLFGKEQMHQHLVLGKRKPGRVKTLLADMVQRPRDRPQTGGQPDLLAPGRD